MARNGRIRKSFLSGGWLPLGVLAFSGAGVSYVNTVFNSTTRWLFLALLATVLLVGGRLFQPLKTRFGLWLACYFVWCVMTGIWSIVPQLSFMKAFATIAVVLTFVAAGRYWSLGWTQNPPLSFLAPVAITAAASIFTGKDYSNVLYQGLTGNPNYLGIIAAAGIPFVAYLIFHAFRHKASLPVRWFSIGLGVVIVLLLARSGSRSALLCAMCVVLSAILTFRLSKLLTAGIIGIALAATIGLVAPEIQDRLYERYVVKYSYDDDVFSSRRQVWAESWEGAREAGLFGLGYGASYGQTHFAGGLTAISYGREKGNTQLAVVEETGLVGLGFYLLLVTSILSSIIGAFRKIKDIEKRFELSLVNGLIVGLIAQSCFEAWWTAPGSVESALFWSSVGVASGLGRRQLAASMSSPAQRNYQSLRYPVRHRIQLRS